MRTWPGWEMGLALLALATLAACGGDGGGSEPEATPGCRLNSDCPIGQICVEAACVEDDRFCEGDDCPCLEDSDCPAGQACDVATGACFDLECLTDADCPLGEVCLGKQCETDVNADRDRDGVPDAEDNCPELDNADQEDNDSDEEGDACDEDDDNDAVPDAVDNCPTARNASQADANGDGVGNACDEAVRGTTVVGRVDFSEAGDPDTSLAQVFITGRQEPVGIDAEGRFVFDQALPEGGTFTLRVLWPGFELFRATYEAPSDVETFEATDVVLALAPATMLGRARLQSQETHEDIRVQAFIGDALVAEARTDEAGIFVLAASEQDYGLRFSKPNYLSETLAVRWDRDDERFEVDDTPLATLETVELRPNLNATLVGTLTSPVSNLPWPEVAVVRLTGGPSRLQEAVQGDGSFQFDQLQPGLYQLDIEVQGHQPRALTVALDAGETTLDPQALELAIGTPLRGLVHLEGRADHSGVLVQASVEGTPVGSTLTAADGAFELPTAALDHRLTFSRGAFLLARVDVTWNRDTQRFELDGQPTQGEVLATLEADRSAVVEGSVQTPIGLPEIATVRLIGEFETLLGTVSPGGDFQLDGVQPGFYVLEVAAQGHLTETRVVSALSGQTVDVGRVALRLEVEEEEESVTLAGIARLSGRQRHAGILVEARVGQALVGSTLTNAAGAFAIPAARLDYAVSFSADGFLSPAPLTVRWNDDQTRFEVEGTALGQLDPAVTLQPDASASITGALTSPLADVDWPATAIIRVIGEHGARQVAPLGDGTFSVTGLQPGRYAVEIQARAHQPVSRDVTLASEQAEALGTLELNLALLEKLEGAARLGGRQSHQGIAVEARIGQTLVGSAVTDAAGAFDLLTARADHRLTLRRDNFITQTIDVAWNDEAGRFEIAGEPLAQSPISLEAARTAGLRGRLTSPIEGLDWPNVAQLTLTGAEETRQAGALPDGGFTFDLLQPGFYVLDIDVAGHLPMSRAVTLADGQTDLGALAMIPEFEAPEEAATMRGTARLQGRDSHLGIVVQAFVGGARVGSAITDETGAWALSAARLDHTLRFSKEDHTVASVEVVWSDLRERFEVAGEPLDGAVVTLQPLLSAGLRARLVSPVQNINWAAVNVAISLVGEDGPAPPPTRNVDEFQFAQLQPGLYGLQIAVEGHIPHAEVVRLRADEVLDLGNIPLSEEAQEPETAVALLGSATLSDGRTPDQVLVRLLQNGVPVATTLTDAQGRFGFQASRVDYRLELTREGYGPEPVAVDVIWNRNTERFEVGGQPLATFAGLVLQRLTGRLTVTVNVDPNWIPDAQRTASLRVVGEGQERSEAAVGDGTPVVFEGLDSGTYVVYAERRGFTLDQALVTIAAGNDRPDVELQVTLVDLAGAGLDLRGVRLTANDLRGVSLLGANLAGANLSGQALRNLDMSGVNLTNADLSGADLGCARLDGANLFGANLAGARLNNTSLRFAALSSANLTNALLSNTFARLVCDRGGPDPEVTPLYTGALFTQAIMSRADARDVDLSGADLNYATLQEAILERASLPGVTMILANLSLANLREANLAGAVLLNAILVDTDARLANLEGARLNSAIVESARFEEAIVRGANFNGTTIVATHFRDADATGARFLGVTFDGDPQTTGELSGVTFNDAVMVGALFNDVDVSLSTFTGADLRSTTFVSVDFTDSAFVGADLTGASLLGANVRGVDFSDADLSFANLSRALTAGSDLSRVIWDGSTCPDGSSSDAAGNTCFGHLYAGSDCTIVPGVSCPNADLSRADLRGANLQGANLEGALFDQADLSHANLARATLGGVIGASFRNARLDAVNFTGANLLRVDMGGARGQGVSFAGADLRAMGLLDTEIRRANFAGADLGSNNAAVLMASFPLPLYSATTTFPGGYDVNAARAQLITNGEVYIPGLLFVMGSPGHEPGHRSDESPQHTAVISEPFLIMATEVTQALWQSLMGNNPSSLVGADLPFDAASWFDALAFANALSTSQGLPTCYNLSACTGTPGVDFTCANDDQISPNLSCTGWRLPTEAEWEGAARSGHQTAFFAGQISVPNGDDPVLNTLGWYNTNANNFEIQPVGGLLASPWGLFDMHGNVFEWVFDWENSDYPNRNFAVDPAFNTRPQFNPQRIIRGGGVFSLAQNTRSAFRDSRDPSTRGTGLRLVRTVPLNP